MQCHSAGKLCSLSQTGADTAWGNSDKCNYKLETELENVIWTQISDPIENVGNSSGTNILLLLAHILCSVIFLALLWKVGTQYEALYLGFLPCYWTITIS